MNSAGDKLEMELQKSIELLTQTLKELQAIVVDPEERAEINVKMMKIKGKIDTLRRILNEIEAAEVVIPEVTPEAAAALNEAINELNKEIEREKQFNEILQAATDILNAAGKVIDMAPKS